MEYSCKDFTGKNLQSADFTGVTLIEKSCFSQEAPDSHIFPDDLTGVTFNYCNLDNVFVPAGNIVADCSTRRFLAHPDGTDWLVDENNTMIAPLNPPPEVI